ncbi:HAMP domain-containing histidine kinase [Microbacteriaceae bacterium VKM Ac-2855]|nr:HAMP domain-containing histidine kinase [Microbacteriaceae bacterium VKM Ac-2855]
MILFAVAAVVFYQVVSSIVDRSERTILVGIEGELQRDITDGDPPHLESASNGQLYLAISPDGSVSETSMPSALSAAVRADLETGAAVDESRYLDLTTARGRYLVRVSTIDTDSGIWTVATARDQAASQLLLDDFTHVLIIAAVALVVIFGAASWVLTGAALAPVRRMRARADELSSYPAAVDQLPVRGTRDELDELATTLNAFLTRQTDSIAREKQMVSDASHELRTPLAALSAQLEIARHRAADPTAVERVIVDAQKSVDRLVRLASALLDISRIESLSQQPSARFAELVDELVGAVDRTRLIATSGDVEIDYEIDERLPEQLYGVAAPDFGRVIDNLVRNAISVSPTAGMISVSLRQNGESLALVVADQGPGMPPEFIPVAFDRFSRPDDARTSTDGGSGLGLALVHSIVSSAGGEIELRNHHPHGLTVEIVLPPRRAGGTMPTR